MNTRRFSRIASALLTFAMLLFVVQTLPAPALEARQELPSGWGDFPRLPIVASGADGSNLALYLIEGDRATRLVEFDGLNVGSDSVIARLSPDGEHVATLLLDSWDGASTLEVVNVEDSGRLTLDQGRGDLTPEGGAAHETISGLAWLDDRHILYSKTISPGAEETEGSQLRGEIWLTDLTGVEQRRLAEAPIYQLLGASSDGEWVYFICDPQQEGYLGDGFCVLDLTSGGIRLLWPRADFSMQGTSSASGAFFGFRLVTMPDGTQRVAFVGSDARSVARSEPPDVWLGDPENGDAGIIWTASQGEPFDDGWSVYDVPVDFLWSPRSEHEFAYLGDGAAFGGVWRVDVENRQVNQLIAGNVGLAAWAEEGIVVQSEAAVWLLDEAGEVRGEIRFSEGMELAPSSVANAVVNWDVPYVHQRWDTPSWWDSPGWWGGNWACGPTSAVMALAYYRRLPPHPITITKPGSLTHSSDYGWYVPTDSCTPGPCGYTHISGCEGTNSFIEANIYKDPPPNNPAERSAAGAFGACTLNGAAYAGRIQTYARRHDVASYYDDSPTEAEIQAELRGGAVVLLDSRLTATANNPNAGHIVVVRGYTSDKPPTRYIVNDPIGDKSTGTYDWCTTDVACGDEVLYTWDDLRGAWLGYSSPKWYIALYGPLYLPDLNKPAYSTDNSVITVYNGAQLSWQYADDVSVCLVNTGGDLNRVVQAPFSIPPHGSWQLSLSDQFSWWEAFSGAATVMVNRPGASVVVSQRRGNSYAATPGIPVGETNDTVHLPVVARAAYGGWYTAFRVQNTGTQATTVRADYYRENGTYVGTVDKTVSPNGSVDFDQSAADHDFGSFGGSAVVTSLTPGVPLAVHVREWYQSTPQFISYAGFSAGATTLSMPALFNRGYGTWSASFSLRNLGPTSASVIIRFEPSGNSTYRCTDYRSISASFTAWLPSYPPSPPYQYCSFPLGWTGSATVTSDQPLVGVVYEHEETTYRVGGYESIASGSTMVVLPYLPNNYESTNASFSIQNLGVSAANVGISYYRSDGTAYIDNNTYSISAGSSRAWYLPEVPVLPGGWLYAAVIVSKSEPIGGMVNVINPYYTSDRFTSYSGENR